MRTNQVYKAEVKENYQIPQNMGKLSEEELEERWKLLSKDKMNTKQLTEYSQTPETIKLGTSSFGLKNSTLTKNDEQESNLMQSSLRGIIFAPPGED